MEESIIYKDIDKLCTPVGEFVVVSESGERIRFSVRKNYYDVPYEVGEDSEHVTGTIQTDTNYCIIIDSDKLQVGTNYKVFFLHISDKRNAILASAVYSDYITSVLYCERKQAMSLPA